jgi:hypothetical protein
MRNVVLVTVLLAAGWSSAGAVDVWRYPEAADKNSLFVTATFFSLRFTEAETFAFYLPEISVDYLPPFFVPVSIGAFFKTPEPNLNSFGTRLAYHINLGDAKTDAYFLYVFDLGFTRNDLLTEYGDEPVPVNYFDFRIGVRRLFGSFVCLTMETEFKMRGLSLGVSVKIH